MYKKITVILSVFLIFVSGCGNYTKETAEFKELGVSCDFSCPKDMEYTVVDNGIWFFDSGEDIDNWKIILTVDEMTFADFEEFHSSNLNTGTTEREAEEIVENGYIYTFDDSVSDIYAATIYKDGYYAYLRVQGSVETEVTEKILSGIKIKEKENEA